MGEIDALEGMGIDPIHYLVLPRFLAAIVSVFGLLIVFDLAAVLAGLVGAVSNDMTSARYLSVVLDTLTLGDVGITIAKGLVFGIVIGTVPSFHGLRSSRASTDVPIAAAQAVVVSIVGIFVLSAVFVAVG
jgi:phospholipid/cholesterol/gamma-HCH transport system permease protein